MIQGLTKLKLTFLVTKILNFLVGMEKLSLILQLIKFLQVNLVGNLAQIKIQKKKANHDYQNRTKGISNDERQNLTFIFVTPRNWKDKKTWEQEKRDQKEWKDVKVYDADDIEQWIEQSPVTQVWFLEKIGKYNKDLWSLDKAWEKWSCCDPKDNLKNLNRKLFYEIAESNLNLFSSWLKSNPKNFILTANSIDEALAFLSCLFGKLDNGYFYDKSVIVNSDEALEKISVNTKQIIITTSKEARKEFMQTAIIFRS